MPGCCAYGVRLSFRRPGAGLATPFRSAADPFSRGMILTQGLASESVGMLNESSSTRSLPSLPPLSP
eukprot:2278974-Prymnesium_polylepis.1